MIPLNIQLKIISLSLGYGIFIYIIFHMFKKAIYCNTLFFRCINTFSFTVGLALFYFFFNVAYTSFTLNNILSSLCYFFIMLVLSNYYWKTNNLTASIMVISISNIITYFIVM